MTTSIPSAATFTISHSRIRKSTPSKGSIKESPTDISLSVDECVYPVFLPETPSQTNRLCHSFDEKSGLRVRAEMYNIPKFSEHFEHSTRRLLIRSWTLLFHQPVAGLQIESMLVMPSICLLPTTSRARSTGLPPLPRTSNTLSVLVSCTSPVHATT